MPKKKPRPITRKELAGMSHSELASVKTKRRLMVTIPTTSAKPQKPKPATEEGLRPRERLSRAHRNDDGLRARQARRGELNEKGANDGD